MVALTDNTMRYIVLADLNVDYKSLHSTPSTASKQCNINFLYTSPHIKQLIDFPTRGIHTLDYIITNDQLLFDSITAYPPIGNSDDDTIISKLKLSQSENNKNSMRFRNFEKS